MSPILRYNFDNFVVGLGLMRVSPEQNHIGFIYLDANEINLRICHFCWHEKLENRLFTEFNDYCISEILLDEVNGSYLCAVLDTISDINKASIPYGFRAPIQTFNEKLVYVGGTNGEGLTCATFILEVLKMQGYQILNESSWQVTPGDTIWQQQILATLWDKVSPEHRDGLSEAIGKVARFRPEQVFGCGVIEPTHWPVEYENAVEMANNISTYLNSVDRQVN